MNNANKDEISLTEAMRTYRYLYVLYESGERGYVMLEQKYEGGPWHELNDKLDRFIEPIDDKLFRGEIRLEVLEEVGYLHTYAINTHEEEIKWKAQPLDYSIISSRMAVDSSDIFYHVLTREMTTDFSKFPRYTLEEIAEIRRKEKERADWPATKLEDLQAAIVKAYKTYDTHCLDFIDPKPQYGYTSKAEFLEGLREEIIILKINYSEGLYMKSSVCIFCNPGEKTFAFHAKSSHELVLNLLILKENNKYGDFMIHKCPNRPLPEMGDGELPF